MDEAIEYIKPEKVDEWKREVPHIVGYENDRILNGFPIIKDTVHILKVISGSNLDIKNIDFEMLYETLFNNLNKDLIEEVKVLVVKYAKDAKVLKLNNLSSF